MTYISGSYTVYIEARNVLYLDGDMMVAEDRRAVASGCDSVSDAHLFNLSFPTHPESGIPEGLSEAKYVPRWYLTPILRVSKRWYEISVKYLYQSVGSDSQGAAEALYRRLEANPQAAALVERLHLGNECNRQSYDQQNRTNINILKLCPNVKHVEICGYEGWDDSKLNALVDVLKTKSLVSFCISQRDLPGSSPSDGIRFSQLRAMMQRWPKLRSIQVERVSRYAEPAVDPRPFTGCCPDLREIVIYRAHLQASEYASLRAMCNGGVTKFAVSLLDLNTGNLHEGKVDALCETLRAWSPTLEHLKIDAYVSDYVDSYRPLDEAIATLGELRQLQIGRLKLDLGSISNLPRLERLACFSRLTEEEIQPLSTSLEDLGKLPSLSHIVLGLPRGAQLGERLQDVCRRRNIQLHEYEIDKRSWMTVCPIIDVFSGSVDWH